MQVRMERYLLLSYKTRLEPLFCLRTHQYPCTLICTLTVVEHVTVCSKQALRAAFSPYSFQVFMLPLAFGSSDSLDRHEIFSDEHAHRMHCNAPVLAQTVHLLMRLCLHTCGGQCIISVSTENHGSELYAV